MIFNNDLFNFDKEDCVFYSSIQTRVREMMWPKPLPTLALDMAPFVLSGRVEIGKLGSLFNCFINHWGG